MNTNFTCEEAAAGTEEFSYPETPASRNFKIVPGCTA